MKSSEISKNIEAIELELNSFKTTVKYIAESKSFNNEQSRVIYHMVYFLESLEDKIKNLTSAVDN